MLVKPKVFIFINVFTQPIINLSTKYVVYV